ncbi:MAG: glycosyltransferase family 2 protein [Caldilineaceae bacterium]|nr:glycosyltransferase family 2 protein [Caldilineaceae bacterium]
MISRDVDTETMPPSIFVVVLNWNQWSMTAECVKSLLQLDYPNMHLVIVDNGSTDGSTDKLDDEFGDSVTILANAENLGYAGGNNVGIRYAIAQRATHIMILNNDTIVAPGLFAPLVQRLTSDSRIGVVAPKIYFMEPDKRLWAIGGTINWWLGSAHSLGKGQYDLGQYDLPRQIDYATGCCFLARSEVFAAAGLLDEAFFAYFEDSDWCMRVRECGWQIWYEPKSTLQHWAGASSRRAEVNRREGNTSAFVYYLNSRNNLWFLRRHARGMRLPIGISMFMFRHVLYYSLAFIVIRRWTKLRHLWRGVTDGFRSMNDGAKATSTDNVVL